MTAFLLALCLAALALGGWWAYRAERGGPPAAVEQESPTERLSREIEALGRRVTAIDGRVQREVAAAHGKAEKTVASMDDLSVRDGLNAAIAEYRRGIRAEGARDNGAGVLDGGAGGAGSAGPP